MTDDFKKFLTDYKKSPDGIKRQTKREKRRRNLLLILLFGFIISCAVPGLFLLWIPYLIFVIIYSLREWMG